MLPSGTFFGWSVIFYARIQSIEPKQVTVPYRLGFNIAFEQLVLGYANYKVFQEELICFENE
ncbi:hypothetical protein DsansV1_C16g0140941 [Dioscorea sansibarensis]